MSAKKKENLPLMSIMEVIQMMIENNKNRKDKKIKSEKNPYVLKDDKGKFYL